MGAVFCRVKDKKDENVTIISNKHYSLIWGGGFPVRFTSMRTVEPPFWIKSMASAWVMFTVL